MGGLKASILMHAGLALGAPRASAAMVGSAYTTHDFSACGRASSDDVVETRLCAGYAGIPVRWIGEPDGTAIEFGRKVGTDGLGEDFSFVGRTVEWRGPVRGRRIAPVAAIVRVDVLPSTSGPVRKRLLVVHKLGRNGGSCIAAIVNAGLADGNERARRAADEVVPGFRCGTDRGSTIGF